MQKEAEWKGEDESQTNGKSVRLVFRDQQSADFRKSLFKHLNLYSQSDIGG